MNVHNKTWNDQITGTSTAWANLPTAMELNFTADGTNVLVFAHISRVQHDSDNVNTEFRIMVNDTNMVSSTNTGNSFSWNYRSVDLVGYAKVTAGQQVEVQVQYKTQRGKVIWFNNRDGYQERQLIVLNF